MGTIAASCVLAHAKNPFAKRGTSMFKNFTMARKLETDGVDPQTYIHSDEVRHVYGPVSLDVLQSLLSNVAERFSMVFGQRQKLLALLAMMGCIISAVCRTHSLAAASTLVAPLSVR
jgi:hypothetical protein